VGEMAEGHGGEALVIRAEGFTRGGAGGDAQLRKQGQDLREPRSRQLPLSRQGV
jgi:hypothetical protein